MPTSAAGSSGGRTSTPHIEGCPLGSRSTRRRNQSSSVSHQRIRSGQVAPRTSRWAPTRIRPTSPSACTSIDVIIRVPVAHGEGNYFVSNDTIKQLEDNDQIAFRYTNANGDPTAEANPNGSVANIAGVFNESKTIMGMMPHPEDAVVPHAGNQTGTPLFTSIVEALA